MCRLMTGMTLGVVLTMIAFTYLPSNHPVPQLGTADSQAQEAQQAKSADSNAEPLTSAHPETLQPGITSSGIVFSVFVATLVGSLGFVVVSKGAESGASTAVVISAGFFQLGSLLLFLVGLSVFFARSPWLALPSGKAMADPAGELGMELRSTQLFFFMGGSTTALALYDGMVLCFGITSIALAGIDLTLCGVVADPLDLDPGGEMGAAAHGVHLVNVFSTAALSLVSWRFTFLYHGGMLCLSSLSFLLSYAAALSASSFD